VKRQATARQGFHAWKGQKILPDIIKNGSGDYPAYPMGTGGSFPGIKLSGHEIGHPPSSNAKVKEGGAIPPLSICLYSLIIIIYLNCK
jgi:hypothetical protein